MVTQPPAASGDGTVPDLTGADKFATVDEVADALASPGRPVPRWAGVLFFVLAVVTIPWIVVLWLQLPSHDLSAHYRLTWVGFDVALALALARTGWTAWHGRDHVELPAVCAATMLAVDAWFDVLSSSSRAAAGTALASAVLVELPLAGLCVWIAVNAERVRRARLRWALLVDPARLPR
jgi:hypothetical protein